MPIKWTAEVDQVASPLALVTFSLLLTHYSTALTQNPRDVQHQRGRQSYF